MAINSKSKTIFEMRTEKVLFFFQIRRKVNIPFKKLPLI